MTKVVYVLDNTYDEYIGRGNRHHKLPQSIWANPFREGKDGDKKGVANKYADWLINNPKMLRQLPYLRDKTLACWCKREDAAEPCHGDVIVDLLDTLTDHEIYQIADSVDQMRRKQTKTFDEVVDELGIEIEELSPM